MAKTKLTALESNTLLYVINCVMDHLAFDDDWKEYRDNGDIIISLAKEEYLALRRAVSKI